MTFTDADRNDRTAVLSVTHGRSERLALTLDALKSSDLSEIDEIRASRKTRAPDWLRSFLPASAVGVSAGVSEYVSDDTFFSGFNWAAFKSGIQVCGGFPEYLGPNASYPCAGDETVMQERTVARSMRGVSLPEARSRHYVPAERSSDAFALKRAYIGGVTKTLSDQLEGRKRRQKLPSRWRFNLLAQLWLGSSVTKLSGHDESERIAQASQKNHLAVYLMIFGHGLWYRCQESSAHKDVDANQQFGVKKLALKSQNDDQYTASVALVMFMNVLLDTAIAPTGALPKEAI